MSSELPAEIERFLKEREWGNDPKHPRCPLCCEIPVCGHNPNCALARFLWHLNPMVESYDPSADPLSRESVDRWMQENQALTDEWIDAIPECGAFNETSKDSQIFRCRLNVPVLWGSDRFREAVQKTKDEIRRNFRAHLATAIVFGAKTSYTDGTSVWHYVSGFYEQKNRLPTENDKVQIIGRSMKEPELLEIAGWPSVLQEGWIERIEIKSKDEEPQ